MPQDLALMHPLPMTLITLFAALSLLLGIRYLMGRFREHPWVSAIGDFSVALVVAVIVAPWINDYWATKRDMEQRRWNARTAHLERLRPVLRDDAKTLTELAWTVSEEGHLSPIYDHYSEKHLEQIWHRHVLIRDLAAHFSDYFKNREDLRMQSIHQETELRELTRRVGLRLDLTGKAEGRRQEVAYALIRQCIGRGDGIKLNVNPNGGYDYQKGNRRADMSSGTPPQELIDAARAFQEFQPDGNFKAGCEQLTKRGNQLPEKLRALANDATSLAETAALAGECKYTHID